MSTILPVLIPATSPKEADGMLFLEGKPVYGRLLPDDALEVFAKEKARPDFERRFGKIQDSHWAGIKASLTLMQAMEKSDPRHLRNYVAWQAVAEVKAEVELADRLVRMFKPSWARKQLAIIPATVRKLEEKTCSKGREKLSRRVSAGSPLVAASELLWQLNRWVAKARFVIYMDRSKKGPLPALYCPDADTGLAAMVFNRIPTPKGLGVCRRPVCGKSFLRTRPGQQYCSLRCGNADRKARQRARRGRVRG